MASLLKNLVRYLKMDRLVLPGDILRANEAIASIPNVDLGPPIEIPPIPPEADPKNISKEERYFWRSEIKAESDICCASGNAAKVIEYMVTLYPDSQLLFLPDIFLGYYAMNILKKIGRPTDNLWLMMGACHVHEKITAHHVMRQMALH